MELEIRAYEPHDYEACRALWVELTEHHRRIYAVPRIGGDDPGVGFDELLANTSLHGAWVGAVDNEVIALTGLLVDGSEGEVEPVIVTSAMRGRGIGKRMVRHVIAQARARGLSHLNIRPVARNLEAMRAFHRCGF
jgi:GNAT superfamily N-acetyltransferase